MPDSLVYIYKYFIAYGDNTIFTCFTVNGLSAVKAKYFPSSPESKNIVVDVG